ncbi:MAG TPA: potassium-transporting ATPase subunit KdpA, partial [Phycisphaerae bacterium]|nr:potassium-transporting ATPase subunit KdpA [Phycisphaerae bacterium]
MNISDIAPPLLLVVVLLLCIRPLGAYMAEIFEGRLPRPLRWLRPIEKSIYRLCGVRADSEMDWQTYALGVLWLNAAGFLLLYGLQRIQHLLPLNPARMTAVSPDLAFNTAASFITNTNWQSYSGEMTMSYLTQMLGLTVQNFLSGAVGMAVLLVLIRGITRRESATIGNFWVDLTRSVLYVLLPLCVVFALVFVGQGVVQTLGPYVRAPLLQPAQGSGDPAVAHQVIAVGPAASQVAIKHLGTNGGGFFNANSAHPFENPSIVTNFLQCLGVLLIPAALCYTFGRLVRDTRQGWALVAAMTMVMVCALAICAHMERQFHPQLAGLGVATGSGNLEGKEMRFGIPHSTMMVVSGTCSSAGPVDCMHDSLTPIGGLVP